MNNENAFKINFPFPQANTYPNAIKPTNVSQEKMNTSIGKFYRYWKTKYVKASNGRTPGGGYYVAMKGTGGDGNEVTTSEAHGYGMMIFVYMAGYDSEAQKYFDGMYNMYDKHRSTKNKANMSWKIDKSEAIEKDSDSATDGDLDIAFALLLADKQWGSASTIDYKSAAFTLINEGLKGGDIDSTSYRIKLGDWQANQYHTRSSDWMTDHFTAFQKATGDCYWERVKEGVYTLVNQVIATHSKDTGLMPDFIVGDEQHPVPVPAKPNFLEEKTDGDYSWNACRYPWRIAIDYIINGHESSRQAATKISDWIQTSSGGKFSKIYAGYTLNGQRLVNYQEPAFTAPFIVAATVKATNQDFVNRGWNRIANWRTDYYGDSINLLCQLVISGNYWVP